MPMIPPPSRASSGPCRSSKTGSSAKSGEDESVSPPQPGSQLRTRDDMMSRLPAHRAPESRRLDDQNIAAERIERALGGVTKEGMAQPRARHHPHGDDIGVAPIRKTGKQPGGMPVLNIHLGSRDVVPLGELQYPCLHLRQIGAMDLLVPVFREVAPLRIYVGWGAAGPIALNQCPPPAVTLASSREHARHDWFRSDAASRSARADRRWHALRRPRRIV